MESIHWTSYATAIGAILAAIATGVAAFANWRAAKASQKSVELSVEHMSRVDRPILGVVHRSAINGELSSIESYQITLTIFNRGYRPVFIELVEIKSKPTGDVLWDDNSPFTLSEGGSATRKIPLSEFEGEESYLKDAVIRITLSSQKGEFVDFDDEGRSLCCNVLSLMSGFRIWHDMRSRGSGPFYR